MSKSARIFVLTLLAMIAFAANSLLCRLALRQTAIDAVSFTSIRVFSGAAILWLITGGGASPVRIGGSWFSALALFVYAAAFSAAYRSLPAGTGALLLFGAVQATMIFWGLVQGERLRARQLGGIGLAMAGLVVLLFPGLTAPSPGSSAIMLGAGIAWGIYSLRGKSATDPVRDTAGNFLRAAPFAAVASVLLFRGTSLDSLGITYAILSGAVTSGVGYIIWYSVLPNLRATSAAVVQLGVPVLVAVCGILFLHEPLTFRLAFASIMILSGIALAVLRLGSRKARANFLHEAFDSAIAEEGNHEQPKCGAKCRRVRRFARAAGPSRHRGTDRVGGLNGRDLLDSHSPDWR